MFIALLDTCVLWPSLQRDLLLSLAVEQLYRPVWSSAILEELELHEARKLINRRQVADEAAAAQLATTLISKMREAFPDAETIGWEGLEGTFGLPDPDDEHVVAAALVSGAGAIVTHNFKDFPRDRVPSQIEVVSPAQFAFNTIGVDPRRGHQAVQEIAARSGQHGKPKLTVDSILVTLRERYRMEDAVELLSAAADA